MVEQEIMKWVYKKNLHNYLLASALVFAEYWFYLTQKGQFSLKWCAHSHYWLG
jgi:hypothetical protein